MLSPSPSLPNSRRLPEGLLISAMAPFPTSPSQLAPAIVVTVRMEPKVEATWYAKPYTVAAEGKAYFSLLVGYAQPSCATLFWISPCVWNTDGSTTVEARLEMTGIANTGGLRWRLRQLLGGEISSMATRCLAGGNAALRQDLSRLVPAYNATPTGVEVLQPFQPQLIASGNSVLCPHFSRWEFRTEKSDDVALQEISSALATRGWEVNWYDNPGKKGFFANKGNYQMQVLRSWREGNFSLP